jgi:hypothetical protein
MVAWAAAVASTAQVVLEAVLVDTLATVAMALTLTAQSAVLSPQVVVLAVADPQ